MPNEPLYDPDLMVLEDLDFSDPDVALAYLNHPTTEKLTDDLGRAFRSAPAAEQRRELEDHLAQLERYYAQLTTDIRNLAPGSPVIASLREVLASLSRNAEAVKARLRELE